MNNIVFDLKVGFKCNNNCIHCVITDKIHAGNLTTAEIYNIVDEYDFDAIVITGGEPTIRKDFIDIVNKIKIKNKKIILQTNGRMFHDVDFTKSFLEGLNGNIVMAIHSHNPLIHDMITDRKGSWKQTIDGMKNIIRLKSNDVQVSSQTVISKLNYSNLLKTYNFIDQLGVNEMLLTHPHPNGNAMKNALDVVVSYDLLQNEVQKIVNKFGKKISTEALPICVLYPYHNNPRMSDLITTNHHKTVGIDMSNKGSNNYFNDNGFTDNYQEAILSDKVKFEFCTQCKFNDKCSGVWKEYKDINGFKGLKPIKEN